MGKEEEARTTVSTDEVDNVECLCLFHKIGKLLGGVPEVRLIFEERRALWIIFEVFDGGGVQWCFASFWRGYSDVAVRGQDVIRVGELWLNYNQLAGVAVVKNGMLTKYHPTSLPLSSSLSREVRTKRTCGLVIASAGLVFRTGSGRLIKTIGAFGVRGQEKARRGE